MYLQTIFIFSVQFVGTCSFEGTFFMERKSKFTLEERISMRKDYLVKQLKYIEFYNKVKVNLKNYTLSNKM